MANMTTSGQELGVEPVGPLKVGLYNFVSWALLLMAFVTVIFGYGRSSDNQLQTQNETENV